MLDRRGGLENTAGWSQSARCPCKPLEGLQALWYHSRWAQDGADQLVMDTQIRAAYFNSPWPETRMEKPPV